MTENIQFIDLFEKENARDLTVDQVVNTFVPTKTFFSLLTGKNQIVLGSRGSGKTSIAKMLSHSHLSMFNLDIVKDIISKKEYIGIYVPMSTEWLGGVKNKKWHTDAENEFLFKWKLNIVVCQAFIDTIKSCCDSYISDITERVLTEIKIVDKLLEYWSPNNSNIKNFRDVKEYLKKLDYEKQKSIAKERALEIKSNDIIGLEFETNLFAPLQRAIDIVSEILEFPNYTSWILCLDEAEILTFEQQKIINSYLRSSSGNLFFKIITMPYSHNTRETNLGASLNLGDDFEYLYIDIESPFLYREQSKTIPIPVNELFNKRITASGDKYKNIKIDDLLGNSILLDNSPWNFKNNSLDMQLLYKYTSKRTLERAVTLIQRNENRQFDDQIGRKMKGLLYLKEAISKERGQSRIDVYSGTKMVVRCSDANPRKLIRLFKYLLNGIPEIKPQKLQIPILSPKKQTEILLKFSESALIRVQSEEKIGPDLYKLILNIGNVMKDNLHKEKINTEQITSIIISSNISDRVWNLIERAVDNGLLYPNNKASDSNIMPYKSGEFRLAYVLIPYFRLLPRRGDSRSLQLLLSKNFIFNDQIDQLNSDQLSLF